MGSLLSEQGHRLTLGSLSWVELVNMRDAGSAALAQAVQAGSALACRQLRGPGAACLKP